MTAIRLSLAAALLGATALGAGAQELRIGLNEDPDILDPDQSRTFVGRIVYTALCDKLVDITPELELIPQLATEWSWNDDATQLTMQLREGVTFHDGTPFDAEAVAANIDRSQNLEESRRKSELTSITNVEVLGDHEIRFDLDTPDATLLAQLADRAGMMISPTAAEEAGADFGLEPICSGPFSFVERVAQDRIVLEAFPEYWNAEEIMLAGVTYLPIPDTTVRLANLQSGDLDMIERLAATDLAAAEGDSSITVERATSLGYDGMTFNVGNGDRADNPFGADGKLLRQALSAAIDRAAISQVVFNGVTTPGNQQYSPESPFYAADYPVPGRDVERARELLAEAGYEDGVDLEVQVPNDPVNQQVMQVIQSMAGEAGIRISLQSKEFATMLADQTAGDYTASLVGWSGRVDPDGNIHQFMTTNGGINDSGYSNEEVDRLLNEARQTNETEERKALYAEARGILNEDLPIVYLWHDTWLWALSDRVQGFVPYPDGMIRLEGVSLAEN
ncbi:peptide/nickel transport system substrate-binding protein [Palleronia aestuarii]|uniref:Peptide/nickel transport system substrate-binding protein n=1 Tax=Palleronia aestuarii TaxID=568105 RepID=A0A2W7NUD2_9RHOB|nr:ABC transporter substrate-binding protein [Palleronia aestuarii]PZX16946.1 peptide/nickel transport system substrate-binding protein [Palleronia aestuarii]